MKNRVALLSCLCFFVASGASDDHDGHDHGGDASFEWAGIFDTPDDTYTWLAQKVKGKYADPAMKMVILPVSAGGDKSKLEALKKEAEHGFEKACIEVKSGEDIAPKEDTCYKLVFDDTSSESKFTLQTKSIAGVAVFAEHFPTEFENTDHYFKDTAGKDIEPLGQLPEANGHDGHDHGGGDDHDGHDHGGHDGHDHGGGASFEWAGIFDTPGSTYKWSAQKVKGEYADPAMKMVILPVPAGGDFSKLKLLKDEAGHGFEETCIEVKNGGEIVPKEDTCYKLVFDDASAQTLFTVNTKNIAGVAVFAEHYPTEFENTEHYFKDSAGKDIEPLSQMKGTPSFEWAGLFATPDVTYMWTAQKVEKSNGDVDYADATMDLVILPVHHGRRRLEADGHAHDEQGELEELEEQAEKAFGGKCKEVDHGDVIVPDDATCYKLHFHPDLWQTLFTVNTKNTKEVAFFAQHFPIEFENTAHYFKDKKGEDIEPLAQIPKSAADPAPWVAPVWTVWGEVIGATLLVNLVTLIGVILAVPFFAKMMKENEAAFASLLGGFCGGAIIACAFLLLLLESSHFFNEWTDEVDVVWRWGTSVLAGFFFPTVVQVLTGVIFAGAGHEHGTAAQQDVEATESSEKKELAQEDPSARARLFAAVIIGDGFHNLCDGFFIGAAFKACGPSFGWTASLSSILHEIPQELADYSLLTGSLGRLPAWKALVFNFLSGITVMLGAIIVTEVDVGNTGIGVILAFGGGVYLHVSAVECVPRMYAKGLSNKVRLASMAMFILGTMIIGLVLLKHEHCSPPTDPNADPAEAAADPHAGHNH